MIALVRLKIGSTEFSCPRLQVPLSDLTAMDLLSAALVGQDWSTPTSDVRRGSWWVRKLPLQSQIYKYVNPKIVFGVFFVVTLALFIHRPRKMLLLGKHFT